MSEMKDMILDVVERMVKENVDKDLVDIVEQGKWSPEVWELFEENGMTVVAISEENGGAGGDLDDLLNIIRLTGKYAVPIPFAENTFANYLLEYANLNIVEELATYMVSTNQAFTLENNQLSGTALNVNWARHMNRLVTIANSGEGMRLVEVSLSEAEITHHTNLASEPRDTVTFHNVTVSQVSNVLTADQIHYITTLETAIKLALMAGAIDKTNELTIQYTKEREQFGRPIHRFQLVQQHIVQLAGETAISLAAFNNFTAALLSNTHKNEVAYACLRMEEAITAVAAIAHQVHAAIGTTHEHSLHQYTRRLWAWRDEGATSAYWSDVLATELLENGSDSLWTYLTDSKNTVTL
ncbi:acyl-CoA dehydrogenase family protein [Lysinibacillus sp. KU-BSD001]|uniref:acyl-CoA dehydrogenase family protein n=1 Tax=Lysinibacillus sp. KU-BSD001 TaxID=3141328 RepID=UPI0036E45E0A